jgi:ribose/xylose/arabinose/galactoside ABC-type transport system permease subunit
MSDLGRILIGLGILLVVVGIFFVISSRLNLPLGRLPGDFSWRGKGWAVSFPLASSLVISVVLSLLFWLLGHFRR